MVNPNLSRGIESPAKRSEGAEGIFLCDLAEGAVLDIETQHCHYKLVKRADTHVCISGHPIWCPQPMEVEIEGSVVKGSSLASKRGFIGLGMYLVFKYPHTDRLITTSRIRDIRKLD